MPHFVPSERRRNPLELPSDGVSLWLTKVRTQADERDVPAGLERLATGRSLAVR